MTMPVPAQSEIERKRAGWWAEHLDHGMSLDEVFQLIEQLVALYPQTAAERELKCKHLQSIPEFIL